MIKGPDIDDVPIEKRTISALKDVLDHHQVENFEQTRSLPDTIKHFITKRGDDEEAFILANIGTVIRQYAQWNELLPTVRPFFAIKCNPDPLVMTVLHRLGCGFDCASQNEIEKALKIGVDPSDIIFANPCKMNGMIRYARDKQVHAMTFDTANELHKIKLHHPEAKLVLRIATDDKDSGSQLSKKFGATPQEAKQLVQTAKDLGLTIHGVSFHVGSNNYNGDAFRQAISDAKEVFLECQELGFKPTLLDIGGGFPGKDNLTFKFENVARSINHALADQFSDWPNLKVISEPGRYFVSRAYTAVTNVINKKVKVDPVSSQKSVTYYLNDGLYSSYFNVAIDSFLVNEENTFALERTSEEKFSSKLFGPTCDSVDLLTAQILLPELELGDTLYTTDMGAYSVAVAPGNEGFNGFRKTQIHYYLC